MKENEVNAYSAGDIYKCFRWSKNEKGEIKTGDKVGYFIVIAVVGELLFVSQTIPDAIDLLEGEYFPSGGNYNKYEFCNSSEAYKHVLYKPSAKLIEKIKSLI